MTDGCSLDLGAATPGTKRFMPGVSAPKQQLAAFHRATLEPGQSVTQKLDIKQTHAWSILPAHSLVAPVKLGEWRVFTNADEDKVLSFTVSSQ